ncbi:MAG TPA: 6-carboxytetrahydropterin synthase [Deltaproteobacteria bacterium]|nr:6-carboxytetrahydropterin synthase [Deltaproteobacteria bacterium]
MYEATIRKSFSAAHTLAIGGKCEELHGHNFMVDITAGSENVNDEGVVIDFRILKAWADEIFEEIDHKYLNDLPAFQGMNPSAEIIARFMYTRFSERASAVGITIRKVTVWESDNAYATYRGQNSG